MQERLLEPAGCKEEERCVKVQRLGRFSLKRWCHLFGDCPLKRSFR